MVGAQVAADSAHERISVNVAVGVIILIFIGVYFVAVRPSSGWQ